jgi:hypothetical protein
MTRSKALYQEPIPALVSALSRTCNDRGCAVKSIG